MVWAGELYFVSVTLEAKHQAFNLLFIKLGICAQEC